VAPTQQIAGAEQAPAEAEQPAAAAQQPTATETPAAAEDTAEGGAGEQVAPADARAAGGDAAAGGAPDGFVAQIAAADVDKGATYAKRCGACHTFEENGGNKVGPPLWNVVNRAVASVPDFEYSDAMKAFSEGGSKHWDYATLHTYLANPRGVVPGTKMVFPGVKSDADMANLIAYLRTLSSEPAPLPGAQ
jgi:cytochrome c